MKKSKFRVTLEFEVKHPDKTEVIDIEDVEDWMCGVVKSLDIDIEGPNYAASKKARLTKSRIRKIWV